MTAVLPVRNYLRVGDARCLLRYEDEMREKFDHFPSMRWVKAIMKYRVGSRLLEAVISRKTKWQRAGKPFPTPGGEA